MKRFIEALDRGQSTLFPETLEDFLADDNSVRVIDAFVESLDLDGLGFNRVEPQETGRPSYHPPVLLKLCIYGYLNRVQSSRRLEREAGRNVEVMWLTDRPVPDHKTIADFRKGLKDQELIRGINSPENRPGDPQGLRRLRDAVPPAWPVGRGQRGGGRLKVQEEVLEAVQRRLDENPEAMRRRRETAEHPFGTLKARMGATHFLMKRLKNVRTEMALSVLAYNLTRVMNIMGLRPLIEAMRA